MGAGPNDAKKAEAEGDEAAAGGSSKLFRCACVRRWLPLAYREELYHVLRLTGPLLLSRILNYLLPFVTTIFVGHIGNAQLAGYALASATIAVTTTSTGYGLSVACDTLVSQTYGSKNMKRVGVVLQRSSIILLLFCLPCWALLINSYSLLRLLHQEDEVARIAHVYVMAFLPAVPAMYLHILQVAYLQNQGITLPQMYTAAVANIINLAANYTLIFSLQWGVVGSAIANSLSQVVICLLLYGYIRWKGLHKKTWGGWSTECLQEWGSYMRLAIPSAFMICFEWWIWEVGGFLAGILGEVNIAAQHVMLELGAIVYMFPLGVHAAACVRVGNALGAGDTNRAFVTCKVALVLSGLLAVVQGIAITSCKSFIGYIFTADENIVQIVAETLTVYTFIQFFDALLCVCSGILVGCGMQKIAALSNLVAYYCIALPVGAALMFAAHLKILGLWLGLLVCSVLEVVFFLILIFRLDWKKATHEAQRRAGKKVVLVSNRPASVLLNEAMLSDISDGPNTAKVDGDEVGKADGYSPVNTKDQELKTGTEAVGANTSGGPVEEANQSTRANTALSMTQLILRRGSTLLVLLLILITGIAFHVAFPAPEPSGKGKMNSTLQWVNISTPTALTPLDLLTPPAL